MRSGRSETAVPSHATHLNSRTPLTRRYYTRAGEHPELQSGANPDGTGRLRELTARAPVNKGRQLILLCNARRAWGHPDGLQRGEEAISAFEDVIERFGTAPELPLRQSVADALVRKVRTLGELNHGEGVIAVCNDLFALFGAASEPPLREVVAGALFSKAEWLDALGYSKQATTVYDNVIERFSAATELSLRECVANAFVNKGIILLRALGCGDDAIAVYDNAVKRFGAATELPLRQCVANALVNKGITLAALGREAEAIAACDDLIERFSAANEPALQEAVVTANSIRNDLRRSKISSQQPGDSEKEVFPKSSSG